MNLLAGVFIVLCLVAFVSAEGHRSKFRKIVKVVEQRRLNVDELGRRENYRDDFERDTVFNPSPLSINKAAQKHRKGAPRRTTEPTSTSTYSSPTPTTTSTQTTQYAPPPPPAASPTPTASSNNKHNNKGVLEYEQLLNNFDQDDLDDMIDLHKPRRRKNRRQSSRRHHHNRQ